VTTLIAFVQSFLATLRSDEEGATMVEYGLVVAAIAIIALVGAQLVGTNLLGAFNDIAGDML
jgi:pilus assembly protein Flp/PilA